MIDSALYTNSNGASNLLHSMQVIANNLSNINTTGFHADYENFTLVAKKGDASNTRFSTGDDTIYTDPNPGPINYTGRELDVAIDGQGFIAIQSQTGVVGYTRAGSFNVTPDGLLVTNKGELVLGAGGVITIPPESKVSIDKHGKVSALVAGQPATNLTEVGRIKLVEADPKMIEKGADGLYYPVGNSTPADSVNVKLIPESLEGSNVDAIRALTDLIQLSRQYDMLTKHISSTEDNADKSNELLNISS